jgi:hypothetical protein
MPRHRKLPSERDRTFIESLIDQIVLFHISRNWYSYSRVLPNGGANTINTHYKASLAFRVHSSTDHTLVKGIFIAGNVSPFSIEDSYSIEDQDSRMYSCVSGRARVVDLIIHKLKWDDITSYEILTIKDLPLLIGEKHTTSLLAELIKGD